MKTTNDFFKKYPLEENIKERVPNPKFSYMGEEVLKKAIAAIKAGKNILLVGEKSTGKNVLAENLAHIFNRPLWNISFHIATDASSLIGEKSLKDGSVFFEEGPIARASRHGGFAILDEINMARNEALAVLHSSLDHRRVIDIPGYELIKIHPATRFIATMNYGYEGTRDLNEALLSRFVVIELERIREDELINLIKSHNPDLKDPYIKAIARFFKDLDLKSKAHEISPSAPDLRGIFDSLDLIRNGLYLKDSLELTIANKVFDSYERDLIRDLIKASFEDKISISDMTNG